MNQRNVNKPGFIVFPDLSSGTTRLLKQDVIFKFRKQSSFGSDYIDV